MYKIIISVNQVRSGCSFTHRLYVIQVDIEAYKIIWNPAQQTIPLFRSQQKNLSVFVSIPIVIVARELQFDNWFCLSLEIDFRSIFEIFCKQFCCVYGRYAVIEMFIVTCVEICKHRLYEENTCKVLGSSTIEVKHVTYKLVRVLGISFREVKQFLLLKLINSSRIRSVASLVAVVSYTEYKIYI